MPPAERIATFDNDGTLWCEQPLQVQIFFRARPRRRRSRAKDPAMRERQPFKAFLEHDHETLAGARQDRASWSSSFATHAGMTERGVRRRSRAPGSRRRAHPTLGRRFVDCVYQPAARVARLPARERLQDLHRLRRRRRLHARLRRGGLRHPARAGDRLERARRGSRCATARADADEAARARQLRRPRGEAAATSACTSAGGRSSRSATRTATSRCCATRRPAPDARLALLLHHDDAEREFAYDREFKL